MKATLGNPTGVGGWEVPQEGAKDPDKPWFSVLELPKRLKAITYTFIM